LKLGEGPYEDAAWGDYSATVVDPDDISFWTVQQYAQRPSDGPRWGVWWGHLPILDSPATVPTPTSLYLVPACRVIDTRTATGPQGGPALPSGTTRVVQLTGRCGIPADAKAVAGNLTAVSPATSGFLSAYPAGSAWPGVSTISYRQGKTRANNVVMKVNGNGEVAIRNEGSTQHFIIDVSGYFR
jgi:hypothetical protein